MTMHDGRWIPNSLAVVIVVANALGGLPGLVSAGTLPTLAGIQVIPADDVLRDHTESGPNGSLYFIDAVGARWELVISASDPRIANSGDGSFHAVDESDALSALGAISGDFLASLSCEIYLLPYPRAASLSSSFDGHAIYLSPGCFAYTPAQVAGLVSHELGHAVQHALLPDTDTAKWAEYECLRGIADSTLYRDDAAHANRPHEIFAEDFRVLCGGALAAGGGSVENPSIGSPVSQPRSEGILREPAGPESGAGCLRGELRPGRLELDREPEPLAGGPGGDAHASGRGRDEESTDPGRPGHRGRVRRQRSRGESPDRGHHARVDSYSGPERSRPRTRRGCLLDSPRLRERLRPPGHRAVSPPSLGPGTIPPCTPRSRGPRSRHASWFVCRRSFSVLESLSRKEATGSS